MRGFVHTGLVVEDLAAATAFFELLGFDCGDPMVAEGEWVDRIVGLDDMRAEAAMVRLPDGTDTIELVRFHAPTAEADSQPAPPNRVGLRHIAFRVGGLRAVLARLSDAGWETIGDVVDYEGMFLLCYLRGPEGLIVELAERLRS